MTRDHYRLGTVGAAEAVIRDLYLNLRTELFNWASVTFQTPQPRMGYIGQHLTSVVTGFPGGRSGARGKDLILPDGGHAEIKTCYRVDQLGSCMKCGQVVASVEVRCPLCESAQILRKDDSKWLISPKHEADMRSLYDPLLYYLVLFDFEDLADPTEINARIWQVDPRHPGFAFCMVDYYFNIKANSKSGAPFNLWPFSLKFQLMEPVLIYYAKVDSNNRIETLVFPGAVGSSRLAKLEPLTTFARTTGFSLPVVNAVASDFDVAIPMSASKSMGLQVLENVRRRDHWDNKAIVASIVRHMYESRVSAHRQWLPLWRAIE